jgi:hypothetical protein
MHRARTSWICPLVTACATSIVSSAQTPGAIAIVGVSVIDTINGGVIPDRMITIAMGRSSP